jgi:hypothetical protein
LSFEILQHEEIDAFMMTDVEQRTDMGVAQTSDRLCFPFEALLEFRPMRHIRR